VVFFWCSSLPRSHTHTHTHARTHTHTHTRAHTKPIRSFAHQRTVLYRGSHQDAPMENSTESSMLATNAPSLMRWESVAVSLEATRITLQVCIGANPLVKPPATDYLAVLEQGGEQAVHTFAVPREEQGRDRHAHPRDQRRELVVVEAPGREGGRERERERGIGREKERGEGGERERCWHMRQKNTATLQVEMQVWCLTTI
jgi:hypothetical protein